jgi:hypothetical protein
MSDDVAVRPLSVFPTILENELNISSEIPVAPPNEPTANAPRAVLRGTEVLSPCKAEVGIGFETVHQIIETNLRILENPPTVVTAHNEAIRRIDNYLGNDMEALEAARVAITNVLFHSVRLRQWEIIFHGTEKDVEGGTIGRLSAFQLSPRNEDWRVYVTTDGVVVSRGLNSPIFTVLGGEDAEALFNTLENVRKALASGDFFKDDDDQWEDYNIESDDVPLGIAAHLVLEDDLTPEEVRASGDKIRMAEMLTSFTRNSNEYPFYANRVLELIAAAKAFPDWNYNPVDKVFGLYLDTTWYIRLTERETDIFRDQTRFDVASGKNATKLYHMVLEAQKHESSEQIDADDDSCEDLFGNLDLSAVEDGDGEEPASFFADANTVDTFGLTDKAPIQPETPVETHVAPPLSQQEYCEPPQAKEPEPMTQRPDDNKPTTIDPRTVSKDPLKFLKSAEGRVLTVMEACIQNDAQREAIKTLIKKEFRTVMSRYGKTSSPDEEID